MNNLPLPTLSKLIFLSLFFIISSVKPIISQTNLSSDALFTEARKAAFEEKNYPKAIELSKKALVKSPDYTDIRVFLGRLYTWSDFPDSARTQFNLVLKKSPVHEDALKASFDLEYWNSNYYKALEIAEVGLKTYPESADFTINQAKALRALGRSTEAFKAAEGFAIKYPENINVADLVLIIKNDLMVHKMGLSYNFVHFDKRFADDWHLASVHYGKQNKWGSYNISYNYANRFAKNASELELETYPHVSKGLYAYVGGGATLSTFGLFPKYRLGFSLYKSLPNSFEAEAGMRYLRFDGGTTLYVLGFGKYIHKSFVNLRSYLNPGDGRWSKSFNLSWKIFFTEDRYDYLAFNAGTGISPDDRSQINNVINQLKTVRAGIDYSRNISKKTSIGLGLSWLNEEYATDKIGNQIGASFSFQKRFR